MRKKILELLIGSILAVVAVSATTALLFFAPGSAYLPRVDMMQAGAEASAYIALAFVLFWGIPTHLLFLKLQKKSFYWYAVAGFLAGPLFVFAFTPFGDDPSMSKSFQSVFCGLIGALGAALFWYFVVKRVAHHKAPQPPPKSGAAGL